MAAQEEMTHAHEKEKESGAPDGSLRRPADRGPLSPAGRWRELLPGAKGLRVELGCGKGRFTAETAAAEPDVLLIAVEKAPDAMVVAMERPGRGAAQRVLCGR